MKLTLEKPDLLKLLSSALGYVIHEDEVDIQAEPFEVHLKKVRLHELSETPKTAPTAVQGSTITPKDDSLADFEEELSQSTALATLLPSNRLDPDARGLNSFSRHLAHNESEDPQGQTSKEKFRYDRRTRRRRSTRKES